MKNRLFVLGVALISLLSLSAFINIEDPFAQLLKKLEEFAKKYPQEKIHLHLDKPYYAVGEDIWFKAYVIDSRTAAPTAISNILYVELINEQDLLVEQVVLPMKDGVTWGDFKLSDSLTKGNYRIRAYTQWMRNAGPDFFFDKTIKIANTAPDQAITKVNSKAGKQVNNISKTISTIDVQFLPESGSLVQGLPNKIGIKAVNAQGRGEDITGAIVEGDGTEITQFKTTYLGMGNFSLLPLPGKTYQAKIKFKDGTTTLMDLPKISSSGYILNVNNIDTAKIAIKILRSPEIVGSDEFNLVAHQNGIVCLIAKIPAKPLVSLSVPKNTLLSGILTFTLFSADNVPVAERIVFVNNSEDQLKVDIENLKENYAKRENVMLDVSLISELDSIQGNFSVAITNGDIVNPDLENESNILTSLLLTSDLKGYIEKPNHYFLNNDVQTRVELDNLLLTQGWRKIDWKVVSSLQLPVYSYEPEKGLQISGTLTSKNNSPIADGKISLFSSTNGLYTSAAQSDATGKFIFDMLDFNDGTKFTLQGSNTKKQSNLKLKLDVVSKQIITPNKNIGDFEGDINGSLKNYIEKGETYFDDLSKRGLLNRTIMLNEVKVSAEKKKKVERSANLNGPGSADAVITADEILTSVTLAQVLAKVMGIYVVGDLAYSNQAKFSSMSKPPPMSIVIDGQMMDKSYSLSNINPGDIETIEVLRSTNNLVIYGINGGSGVIVITTKLGPDKTLRNTGETESKITYQPKGYQVAREFYMPKHDQVTDQKLDLRPLVYWNPNLVSGEDGKLMFNFSNSDQIGTYRIVIEGMDNKGNLARGVFKYQVN